MLTRLSLVDFQSHGNTTLSLGRFTVVVGPSSSGKSALVRALRVLVSNSNGTSYVRHGARKARVHAAFVVRDDDPLDAQVQVAVERGPGISKYELVIPSQEVIEFTKCGKTVPEMISETHNLSADGVWLAGQFDRPFLLDETGSAIARTLGDLTNVSMIFAAVRECNRRASSAKTRHADRVSALSGVREQLQAYADLPPKLRACEAAERGLSLASSIDQRRVTLQRLVEDASSALQRASQARGAVQSVPDVTVLLRLENRRSRLGQMVSTVDLAAARRSAILPITTPDVSYLILTEKRRTRLHTMFLNVVRSELSRRQAAENALTAGVAAREAYDQLRLVLTQVGSCPVCGADAEHAQLDRISGRMC